MFWQVTVWQFTGQVLFKSSDYKHALLWLLIIQVMPHLSHFLGWTGLFCPCVLFGRNVERMREDIPWTRPCLCHALCVEGGIALAIATAVFHGIDPRTSFLIGEGLVFSWWMCGIYTGLFRQSLQKKYHLKVRQSI